MRLAFAPRRTRPGVLPLAFVAAALVASPHPAAAQVVPVGAGAFPRGSTLLTFAGRTNGTEVNGLSVGGVVFSYSAGNGNVVIGAGPGVTGNVAPPNIVSVLNNAGTLTLTLPGFYNTFGYGFAVLTSLPLANATTISLFNGSTNVGSLSYAGAPDPGFSGGFAGIQSVAAFNRVDLRFNSVSASAFAIDNVRLAPAVIPEPATVGLVAAGLCAVAAGARRRRAGTA